MLALSIHPVRAQERLKTEVVFRIDGWEHDLTRVNRLAPGPANQVAIDNPYEHQVLVFDSLGNRVVAYGREGGGPGEFRTFSSLGWRADSVWVMDGRQGRLTVGLPDAEEWNVYLAPTTVPDAAGLVFPKGYSSDGTILATLIGEEGACRRLDLSADWSEVILRWTPVAGREPIRVGSAILGLRYPFEPEVQLAFAADGSSVAVSVPRSAGQETARARLARVTSNGEVLFDLEVQVPGSRISSATAKARLEARADVLPEDQRTAYFRHDRTPEFYPAISDLILDREGLTWARTPAGEDEWEYRAFDLNGDPAGVIRLSPSQRLVGAQGDRLWVVELDEFDVPSILGLRIVYSGGTSTP
jgi:hypothetical protein